MKKRKVLQGIAHTNGGVSFEVLEDMLQLAGDGVPVVWPTGIDVISARALLLTGRR